MSAAAIPDASPAARGPAPPGPGLDEAEAARRLAADGPNELPQGRPRAWWRALAEAAAEPTILLIVACGVVYFVLGDPAETLLLVFSVAMIVGLGFYGSLRSERTLAALRDLSSPRALVIRGGKRRRVAGREVVRGDLILLVEGDRVPADGRLIAGEGLQIDESLLTGEALPVGKRPGVVADDEAPGGEGKARVWSGSLVTRGRGAAIVEATGGATALGKIGRSLAAIAPERSRLQREIDRLVRVVAGVAALLCGAVFAVVVARGGGALGGLLAGLTMAMAMIPEEFPVVLTGFMALGAWRLARVRVLTNRPAAIETLGAATVLCSDKTGTLTENRQRLAALDAGDATWEMSRSPGEPLPEEFHALLEYAILASQRDPFDPVETAIRGQGEAALAGTEHLHADWRIEREYPLTPELLALAHAWRAPDGGEYVIAAKGAPEAVVDLCHLDDAGAGRVATRVRALAERGLRVLGVARARFPAAAAGLPGRAHDYDFEWCGLAAFEDPLRAEAPAAVRECAGAGIRVMMITGDYPETALTVARAAGIAEGAGALTGAEIDALDDAALAARLRDANVFARVRPEHKLRLVRALRADGEVVAMTGDGVNDAPALRAADIGVAMGARGTDVAREAASLVLLEDDFAALAGAVRLGRRIHDNLVQALVYLLAVHVPIAGLSLLPPLLGWPLLLLPAHIVLLHLIIDPAAALVFETEEEAPGLMTRPPRDPRAPVLRGARFAGAVAQGGLLLGALLALAAWGRSAGLGEAAVRALAFTALVVGNLGLVHVNRSARVSALGSLRRANPGLWWVTGGGLALLALSQQWPPLARLFRAAPLPPALWAAAFAAAALPLALVELAKRLRSGAK